MWRLAGKYLGALLAFAIFVVAASAAERSITLLPDADVNGFDYEIIKGISEKSCAASCVDDQICRAFTYNSKAEWCFLKGKIGPQTPFDGAVSGVVEMTPSAAQIAEARRRELPFPADSLIANATRFAEDLPATDPAPEGVTYMQLVADGDAVATDNPAAARVAYRQALGIVGNDPAVWSKLANVMLRLTRIEAEANGSTYDLAVMATYAALNAFTRQEDQSARARSLQNLAEALTYREMWRETIATYRASLALVDNARLQARLDEIVAEHGFRITSNDVEAEGASPGICVNFSESLPDASTDLSAYVVVEQANGVAVETRQSQLCLTGVEHGRRYALRVRQGLPSATGEKLLKDVDLNVYVPDRSPFVAFANNAYVMPSRLGGGLPITSINAETADIAIYRIGDRAIATAVRDNLFKKTLDGYEAEDVADRYGEQVWEGQVDLASAATNAESVTAIPVGDVIGDVLPGAYVITAKIPASDQEYWRDVATQWFIVSDLGLTAVSGDDGVHVFLRSLDSATPISGAKLRLVALNNEILGEVVTDANGRANFAPGLSRGKGGRAPQLVTAETAEGDYVFLDVDSSGFDLTDRGVEGRPASGPLDVFATTERGVYRPNESVFFTALVRDSRAKAVTGLPLTMEVQRPDGVVASTQVLAASGAGGYFVDYPLVDGSMRGAWHIRLFADRKADALSDTIFLVEDFEPERLAFEVSTPETAFEAGEVNAINVAAKYLYGAKAPGLSIEADAIMRPRSTIEAFPEYRFGRLDDSIETDRLPLGAVGITDADGNDVAEVELPQPQATTKLLEAQIVFRLIDTNGRAVERSLNRPVKADGDRIGIKPLFEAGAGLAEGGTAGFDIIVVAPDGSTPARDGLEWSLSRIDTNYQWYQRDGVWKWEAVTSARVVANGAIDTTMDGPASISADVEWGRYQLEVNSSGPGATSSSYEFYAGYYYAEAGSDTPDNLQVALDKTAYRVGDTAQLKLEPQFAGTALVMVVDNRIIDMVAVEVPEDGATISLPVTDEWGPGAYVTAMLYRPASAEEKRMPARALGLAFADVEPGDLKLDLTLDAPATSKPRQTFTTKVKVGNAQPGDTAYVAVAAVDLGILNLTNFKSPDPDGWYFGQRQLGVTFRDLYGQLIDPTQGAAGALRSGGDGDASRSSTPPPTSVLVAQHSGIVEVDANGMATIEFDMPDFAGTVRLMAMAWTEGAVGHGVKDVIVRDPVVVTLSPPRFLRLGDQSRLLAEINNVEGPSGTYRVELLTDGGIASDIGVSEVELAEGERTALNLELAGAGLGDHSVRLVVTGPNGNALIKELTLGVRAASAPQTISRLLTLNPGESVEIGADYFAGMTPKTGELTLALGPIARLDVPELLLSLDRYPYGCAEQVTSRVLPLLYLNEVARMLNMGDDDALDKTITDAISQVLSKQNSSGGFGIWGPFSRSDLWLDSYVTEFLLRAKDEAYAIPDLALERALDNLGNQVSYASDFSDGGEDVAYGLYGLARAGKAAIGDLRYYVEARLDAFGSPLAKAQLGAALALYGDRTRSAIAFEAAVAGLRATEDPYVYRADYGSLLRDMAAVLALAAEFTPTGVDVAELATRLAILRDNDRYTSTQEDAWTLLAAAALARDAGDGRVSLDGSPITGTAYRRYQQEELMANAVPLVNIGNVAVEAKVSVTAIPENPPAAGGNGFIITRQYFTPDGEPVDMSNVRQNDRFVVLIDAVPQNLGSGQYMLVDPIPAGFEIENSNLFEGSGVADLSWLSLDRSEHTEARTDQYLAAFRFSGKPDSVTTAYLMRAVSPGDFIQPGAIVEDLYRPDLRANTDAGRVVISEAGQ